MNLVQTFNESVCVSLCANVLRKRMNIFFSFQQWRKSLGWLLGKPVSEKQNLWIQNEFRSILLHNSFVIGSSKKYVCNRTSLYHYRPNHLSKILNTHTFARTQTHARTRIHTESVVALLIWSKKMDTVIWVQIPDEIDWLFIGLIFLAY